MIIPPRDDAAGQLTLGAALALDVIVWPRLRIIPELGVCS